ncbi:hypothetical protein J6590_005038 [Homalodisca vitripennis]|nr:hypothetical protein J6590_005038 [Homalodisca vitripennis]
MWWELQAIQLFITAVGGLKLTELLGPRLADRGTSAKLSCNFDTENARLYSVKWYKDEYEFFRYMPDNHPHSQVFPRDGVTLDESMSGIDHVVLTSLSFSSTGVYRCEVSTEAPNFETLFLNHNMTVLCCYTITCWSVRLELPDTESSSRPRSSIDLQDLEICNASYLRAPTGHKSYTPVVSRDLELPDTESSSRPRSSTDLQDLEICNPSYLGALTGRSSYTPVISRDLELPDLDLLQTCRI